MNDTLLVWVPVREHANLDSLPLRFGLHFQEDTQIELYGLKRALEKDFHKINGYVKAIRTKTFD